MRALRLACLAVALASAEGICAAPAGAARLTVGAGSTLDLGTGFLDLGCADLTVEGTLTAGSVGIDAARNLRIEPAGMLDGGSAILEVRGDWDDAGSFVAGMSTVRLMDGCGGTSAVVVGDNTFANLEMSTTSGKLYSLTAGSTQTVTGFLSILGAASNLLVLRSTSAGLVAFFNVQGGGSGDFVDVDDNDASAGNPIVLDENSVAGLNTPGWTFAIPIPALPRTLLVLLVLGTAGTALRVVSRTRSGSAPIP